MPRRGYFDELQDRLECYDRVLYEMVADTKKPGAGDADGSSAQSQSPARWVPPKRRPPRRRSLVSRMQTAMAGMLRLSFQLDAMDYRRDNWQRADLELSTFRRLQVRLALIEPPVLGGIVHTGHTVLDLSTFLQCAEHSTERRGRGRSTATLPQKERKESVWTLARRVSRNVREALLRSLTEDMAWEKGELQQWRSLWLTVPQWRAAATLLPMPLLMQLLIYAWLHEMAPPPVFSASGSDNQNGEQRGVRPALALPLPPVLFPLPSTHVVTKCERNLWAPFAGERERE